MFSLTDRLMAMIFDPFRILGLNQPLSFLFFFREEVTMCVCALLERLLVLI
jgi:hypothetical protein